MYTLLAILLTANSAGALPQPPYPPSPVISEPADSFADANNARQVSVKNG